MDEIRKRKIIKGEINGLCTLDIHETLKDMEGCPNCERLLDKIEELEKQLSQCKELKTESRRRLELLTEVTNENLKLKAHIKEQIKINDSHVDEIDVNVQLKKIKELENKLRVSDDVIEKYWAPIREENNKLKAEVERLKDLIEAHHIHELNEEHGK